MTTLQPPPWPRFDGGCSDQAGAIQSPKEDIPSWFPAWSAAGPSGPEERRRGGARHPSDRPLAPGRPEAGRARAPHPRHGMPLPERRYRRPNARSSDQLRNIENHEHAAVAEQGRTHDAGHAGENAGTWASSKHPSSRQIRPLRSRPDRRLRPLPQPSSPEAALAGADLQKVGKPHEGQGPVAQDEGLGIPNREESARPARTQSRESHRGGCRRVRGPIGLP